MIRHKPVPGYIHRPKPSNTPLESHLRLLTVQAESDMQAAVRQVMNREHYNPRHVPAVRYTVDYAKCAVVVTGTYIVKVGPEWPFNGKLVACWPRHQTIPFR